MTETISYKFGTEPRYPLGIAADIIGITHQRLRSWLVSYSAQEPPINLDREDRPIYLSFFNLIEAKFIAEYRKLGVPMQRVRRALSNYTQEHPSIKRPLLAARFQTDGTDIFARFESETGETLCMNYSAYNKQPEWDAIIGAYFKSIDYDDFGLPVEFWPASRSRCIKINPRIEFGRPVIARTGIRTEAIASRIAAGDDVKFVARDFAVTSEEITEAITWERDTFSRAA